MRLIPSMLITLVLICNLIVEITICSENPKIDSLNDELDRILDDNGFDRDMEDFLNSRHQTFKQTKSSDKSKSLPYAMRKISNLQALIGQIKHGILSKFVSVSRNKFLQEFELTNAQSRDPQNELKKLELILARALVRSKVTILLITAPLWKQLRQVFRLYEDDKGIKDILDDFSESNMIKDPFNVELELDLQSKVLARYLSNTDQPIPVSTISKGDDYLDKLFANLDEIINLAFECEENECVNMNAGLHIWETSAAPLANEQTVANWIDEFVEDTYVQEIEKSERDLSRFAKKENYFELKPEDWEFLTMEQIEEFRLSLRSDQDEEEFRENFLTYFMD